MKNILKYGLLLPALLIFTCTGCRKMAGTDLPPNQLTPDKVFGDSSSAVAATANLYTLFGTVDANFIRYIGTYTDELKTTTVSSVSTEFTNGSLTTGNTAVLSIWQNLYATIYKANALLEGIQPVKSLPPTLKNTCMGEARFVRAYCYYQLVNIYGDVPLVLTTAVTQNAKAARSPAKAVMTRVILDLTEGQRLLPTAYPFGGEKIQANRWAAAALLAKAYLFNNDYVHAGAQADQVISSGQYNLLSNLNQVFTANNAEAILQLWNSTGASTLNSVPSSGIPVYQVSPQLLASFETGDKRRTSWVNSVTVSGLQYYYPYTYKQRNPTTGPLAEYSTYIRLAELYLIRGESRLRQQDLSGARADLNTIRQRAGLPATTATTADELLTAIRQERQAELFNEGGNRFIDLKRYQTIDQVLSPIKPLWKPSSALFPIPQAEILNDPNLTQNPGY
ncbi:RagB/SusD family nutrient uptake outer membrane protein [Mucilaginibacter sp. NFX135]|uniref:RagB/SusD family nutrient uptake outer membrane protein n=1 Tax=Mucilaginibacter sp. NFX135 TaxID=3402687 RepID=UPI003AFB79D6